MSYKLSQFSLSIGMIQNNRICSKNIIFALLQIKMQLAKAVMCMYNHKVLEGIVLGGPFTIPSIQFFAP